MSKGLEDLGIVNSTREVETGMKGIKGRGDRN